MSQRVSKKEFYLIWGAILLIISLYFIFNHLAKVSAPHPSVMFEWEKNIPFIALFIVPYQSLYFIVVALMLLLREKRELVILMFRLFFIFLTSYGFFLFMPLTCVRIHPPIEGSWLIVWLFSFIDANDLPYNQLPSLHISSIVVYWYSLRCHLNNVYIKNLTFIWFILIGLSTLLVYQHHFLDIPTGLLLGLISIWIFSEKTLQGLQNNENINHVT